MTLNPTAALATGTRTIGSFSEARRYRPESVFMRY